MQLHMHSAPTSSFIGSVNRWSRVHTYLPPLFQRVLRALLHRRNSLSWTFSIEANAFIGFLGYISWGLISRAYAPTVKGRRRQAAHAALFSRGEVVLLRCTTPHIAVRWSELHAVATR